MTHTLATWEPGTQVTLCNVPWNSDYRDIVKFVSDTARDDYINTRSGPSVTIASMIYAKPGMPVKVNLPFNACYKYNYLRVVNNAPNDTLRAFYYFIQDVEYAAPNTTILHIQLDAWQTFGNDIQFGCCYVERGHIGIANSNAMLDNGRAFLTEPEGLDIGGEYQITSSWAATLGVTDPTALFSYDILVVTTVSFQDSGGTVDAPILKTATGSGFEGLPNGAEVYHFVSSVDFGNFMSRVSETPWIAQGIVSIMAVPALTLPPGSTESFTATGLGSIQLTRLIANKIPSKLITIIPNWRDSFSLTYRYSYLDKFKVYPYSVVELTTYSGNPLLLKPESIGGSDLSVVQLTHLAQPSPRVSFYPYRYNSIGTNYADVLNADGTIKNDNAEFLDMTTGIFDMPTFSTVNNSFMAFMAANKNSIAYQHSAADWSQQRALQGNSVSAGQATNSMAATSENMSLGLQAGSASNDAINQAAMAKAIIGGAGAVVAGVSGGPFGVGEAASLASGAAGTAVDMVTRNRQLAISQGLTRAQTGVSLGNQAYQRDTNKAYADYAAQGDYAQAIAGINAKVQDARLIQPTTSGQVGGDAFNLAVYEWSIHAKVKLISSGAMASIGEFWLRFGYQVNRFSRLPDSLLVMDKFTYWKLRQTYLRSSSCPETYRQTIRGIFEKGVTVWANPEDMGNIDTASNTPLPGIVISCASYPY